MVTAFNTKQVKEKNTEIEVGQDIETDTLRGMAIAETINYSKNPQINQTIANLLRLGLPPLPVAPLQERRKDWCHIVAKTKEGFNYCPLDKSFQPIPRFTGKNPSFLSKSGQPFTIKHKEFQIRQPREAELRKWFANPKNGIGTLGGHAGVDWLDFDRKNYDSQEECDREVQKILDKVGTTWVERTGSGGWRIAVKPSEKPKFTNFTVVKNGPHVGEALFKGRFTVLAPTVHPNGNTYERLDFSNPAEIESLEAIGIYQYRKPQVIKPVRPVQKGYVSRIIYNLANGDERELAKLCLQYIDPDLPYDDWLKLGMALKTIGDDMFSEWDSWSSRGQKYTGDCDVKWRSFKGNRVTIATLVYYAKHYGFEPSKYFKSLKSNQSFSQEKSEPKTDDLSKYKRQIIDEKYLPVDLKPPENTQLVGLKAMRGTGKSYYASHRIAENQAIGKKTLGLNHRINLGRSNSKRWGIDYIDDLNTSITQGIFGMNLCVDSMRKNSRAKFDPEEWRGSDIIIDEVVQVIWHMLNSSTCQKYRVDILKVFEQTLKVVVESGGRIYLADADLNSIVIDLIHNLLGEKVPTWILQNERIPIKRNLYKYNTLEGLIFSVTKQLERGKKCLFHTGAQKPKSRGGTYNLELYYKRLYPDLKIIRIDKDTIADPTHPAFRCTNNINGILPLYDLTLASPALETGISIETNQFDFVADYATGTQTVEAVCQAIDRDRSGVDRHIYAPEQGLSFVGNRSTDPVELSKSEKGKAGENIGLLNQAGLTVTKSGEWRSHHFYLEAWSKLGGKVNEGMHNYRESIYQKLTREGYTIKTPPEELLGDKSEVKSTKQNLKENRDRNYTEFTEKVEHSRKLPSLELQALKDKTNKTEKERLEQIRGEIEEIYHLEPDSTLIKQHEKGLHPKLRLQYYLTWGREYLPHRDKQKLVSLSEAGGAAFIPDINKKLLSAAVKTLEKIEIEQFLDGNREFSKTLVQDWNERIIQPELKREIKNNLGISLTVDNDKGIENAKRILNKLGLDLPYSRRAKISESSQRERIYLSATPQYERQSEIFRTWLEKDRKQFTPQSNELNKSVHPPSSCSNQKTSTPLSTDEIRDTANASTPCLEKNLPQEIVGQAAVNSLEEEKQTGKFLKDNQITEVNIDQYDPAWDSLEAIRDLAYNSLARIQDLEDLEIVKGLIPNRITERINRAAKLLTIEQRKKLFTISKLFVTV